MRRVFLSLLTAVFAVGCGGSQSESSTSLLPMMPDTHEQAPVSDVETPSLVIAGDIDTRLAKFATVVMDFDESKVSSEDKKVLLPLIEANRIMHELFMAQIDPDVPGMLAQLADHPSTRAYFGISKLTFYRNF